MTLRRNAPRAKRRWLGLTVTVTLALGLLAGTALAAPAGISLEQCRNGSVASPSDCTKPGTSNSVGWVNGNVGASQGHLLEGYSIPYRSIMTNLPVGTPVTVTLGYDITHSGKHAIDYLTQYERLDPHAFFGHAAEQVLPLSGVSGVSGTTDTEPITAPSNLPAAPLAGFNALSADKKVMTLFGGTIADGSFTYVELGDINASQSEARISLTFTPASATAVLAWGGHIARGDQWDGQSASAISGSPYHMRVKAWTLGNVGNQDRSLSAGAVQVADSAISTQPSFTTTFSVELNDSATVTGDTPTGTVTFKLWDQDNPTCDPLVEAALYTETVALAGGSAATTGGGSGSNDVSVAGTYHWTADYSGDGGNNPSSSACASESVTVTAPSITTVPTAP